MRDQSGWHRGPAAGLKAVWPEGLPDGLKIGDLLDVEFGLYVLTRLMPGRPALDAWTLFGGYPYSEAFGDVDTDEQRLMIRRARHYLWGMRRGRYWRRCVERYLTVPQELRGFDLESVDDVPARRAPAHAHDRFDVFEALLLDPPAFTRRTTPKADVGEYWFPVGKRRHAVDFDDALLDNMPADLSHDLDVLPPGGGQPIEVEWSWLEDAASEMDELLGTVGVDGKKGSWEGRLARVKLLMRDEVVGRFAPSGLLRIEGLLHLVGMVGAGKSTLRDILAFWAAGKGLRITLVVGDVAEELAVVELFTKLGVDAAPIIGHSTREKHIARLHRRVATAGAETMLEHQHSGFAHLSSACPVDALRGFNASAPLRIGEAPCELLYPAEKPSAPSTRFALFGEDNSRAADSGPKPGKRHLCPLWVACPRHRSARTLVDAKIWVANPMSLVHSGVPNHLNAERMRYLELACHRSDLVVVDEADRVQMQLDTAFAPSTTLVGRAPNSWLDEVAGHKIAELAQDNRMQLSRFDVAAWTAAVDTVTAATNQLYTRLVSDEQLRKWITEDYFSALTLHRWLIGLWFPELRESEPAPLPEGTTIEERTAQRDRIDAILDEFRDDPLREHSSPVDPLVNELVHLALQLLHIQEPAGIRPQLTATLRRLLGENSPIEADVELNTRRFEFTLILAALHHRLDTMTVLWTQVEAALNLESTSNVLARRPPKDFEPVIPESPMGNVLGFQFQRSDRDGNGDQSGELRFFRCNGVGRELLHELHRMPQVDGRPGPNVMLMSATSWAGESSRYHVHAPVGAVLRPNDEEVQAVLESTFRKEFLYWPDPKNGQLRALKLSGADAEHRPRVLKEMLRQLAVPDRTLVDSVSRFEQELASIEDPERRRLLVLVGSYAEARRAVEYLETIPEWKGRVTQLVSDDSDLDDTWTTLRRGDVATFPTTGGEILVAPLLAVERGHNIVVPGGKAAIGAAYFLARPHPRPDDIALAIQAINDWAVRQVRYGEFHQAALAAGSPNAAGVSFRSTASKKWNRFLTRELVWMHLPEDEKRAFTWDQLVVMWQVIGRLVRGGVSARAIFVDAAFSPLEAGYSTPDTPDTSLLESMRAVLAPYFEGDPGIPPIESSLVESLYEPLYRALAEMD